MAAALLSGALYFAAFPPLDLGLLGWLALAPLLVSVSGRRTGVSLGLGWLAGTVACNGLTTPALLVALPRADLSSGASIALAVAIPQLFGALPFAGFAAIAAALMRRRGSAPIRSLVAVASAWAAIDLLRARLLGCPWVLLAHSQHARLWVLQVADLGGAPAVGFLLALVSALAADVALAFVPSTRVGARAEGSPEPAHATSLAGWTGRVAFVGAALVAAGLYGRLRLDALGDPAATRPMLRIAVVQPDIPREWRTSLGQVREAVARLAAATAEVMDPMTRLVVWPENAVGVSVGSSTRIGSTVRDLLAASSAELLLGAPREVASGPGRAALRNSAVLINRSGRVVRAYDKRILVPFGEVAPASGVFEVFGGTPGPDAYTAGDEWTLFPVAGSRFAVLICFEGIFADAVRSFVSAGAELLVNLSNDDWFGGEAARDQHFRATALRAIETRRFLVRATNSGVSAVVAPTGEVVAQAPVDATVTLVADVTPSRERTLYSRFGDLFGWLCGTATLLALVALRRRARSPNLTCDR